uniref:Capsid protein n=1 Tax=Phytophthora palustris toti-like virus 3-1 TaxID=2976312 RepID=A0A9E9C0V0_9VIRU|nr:capsid protein [Phytophthora palustris toti-like virus 3-1]
MTMSKSFTNVLFKESFVKSFGPDFAHGLFGVQTKGRMTMRVGEDSYVNNYRPNTYFRMVGLKTDVRFDIAHTDYSGFNSKLINGDGSYNGEAALTEYARTAPEKRLLTASAALDTYTTGVRDSHEAFLYNMCISWMHALLYKHSGGKDKKFVMKNPVYSDSHGSMAASEYLTAEEITIEVGPPAPAAMAEADFTPRQDGMYWGRPYVVRYPKHSAAQEVFYLSHIVGREHATPIHGDVVIPGLDPELIYLERTSGSGGIHMNPLTVDWGKPEEMWLWIKQYVEVNRLHSQFAAVLETYLSVLVQPVWSNVESHVWEKTILEVRLGAFNPTRAMIRLNLDGLPYTPYAAAHEVYEDNVNNINMTILQAGVANYLRLLGTYATYDYNKPDLPDKRSFFLETDSDTTMFESPESRAAAISVITGQEVVTCMTQGAHSLLNLEELQYVTEVTFGPNGVGRHYIDKICSPVTGALVLGMCNSEIPAVAHLAGHHVIEGAQALSGIENDKALAFAQGMRILGCDMEYRSNYTRGLFRTWTPVKEWVLLHGYWSDWKFARVVSQLDEIVERPNSHGPHPEINDLVAGKSVTITYTAPALSPVKYGTTTQLSLAYYKQKPQSKLKFKVRAPYSAELITQPKQLRFAVSDFRLAPEPILGPGLADAEQTDLTAEGRVLEHTESPPSPDAET